MSGRLNEKVALVTGAASGIGAAIAQCFVEEGARVVIADVADTAGEELAASLGDRAVYAHLDVADEAQWQTVVDATLARWQRIDILINNAGFVAFHEIAQYPVAEFRRILDVNLFGTFLGTRIVGNVMLAQRRGAIVNMSSVDGMKATNGASAYAASKWGVRGFTKAAALEYGHRGVRVNSVHPGTIDTPLSNPGRVPAETFDVYFRDVPLQRTGRPMEVARACLFLASDESSYCNGAELAVDGGVLAGQYQEFLPGAPAAPTPGG
jgi:3alpha(or 20beta)-hydroxysteroid dehydrogenase